jgi:transcriptional regulator with XRE-family HTH domain
MDIGERIVLIRERLGLTQKQLALKTGINVSVLNRIEKNKRPAYHKEVIAISEVLEVSTDYLLKGVNIQQEAKNILNDPNTQIAARDGDPNAEETLKLIEEILKSQNKGK